MSDSIGRLRQFGQFADGPFRAVPGITPSDARALLAVVEAAQEIAYRPCRVYPSYPETSCNSFDAKPKCESCVAREALAALSRWGTGGASAEENQ